MKKFKVSPHEIGINVVVSPVDRDEIYENKDLIATMVDNELYPRIDNWDYEGFVNSIPSINVLSFFKNKDSLKDLLSEFEDSDEDNFYDYLDFEDKIYEFLEDYITYLYPNAFMIEREGCFPPKSFEDEYDSYFYVNDPENVLKNITNDDFQVIQIENQPSLV